MSGAFIPVSEDAGMIEAARVGALSLEKLEAWTSVCSVGIDMVAVPGSTSAETIAAIIADEMAIGVMNNKTTAVRIIPVPGREVGEMVEFGGLLGSAPEDLQICSSRYLASGAQLMRSWQKDLHKDHVRPREISQLAGCRSDTRPINRRNRREQRTKRCKLS